MVTNTFSYDFTPGQHTLCGAVADVGGTLKVASLNVLNYFATINDGSDNCGPSADMDNVGAPIPRRNWIARQTRSCRRWMLSMRTHRHQRGAERHRRLHGKLGNGSQRHHKYPHLYLC